MLQPTSSVPAASPRAGRQLWPDQVQVEPRRWKVEQTLGRLRRYRRPRLDDEMNSATSRPMTILVSALNGMRLERTLQS